MNTSNETFLVVAVVFVVVAIIYALDKAKAKDAAEEIGRVRCDRCGHEGVPKVQDQATVKGRPLLVCERCLSEDWRKVEE